MAQVYADVILDGSEDCNVQLKQIPESGRYSVRVGRLAIIGDLEDLNDIGFEIFHLTKQEREKKAQELAVVDEVLSEAKI